MDESLRRGAFAFSSIGVFLRDDQRVVVAELISENIVHSSGTKTAFSPLPTMTTQVVQSERERMSSVDYDGSISGSPALRRKWAVSRYPHMPPYLGQNLPEMLSYRVVGGWTCSL
jgi:hypothetical protein